MGWLAFGVVYTIGYAVVALLLRDHAVAVSWFRAAALPVMPLIAAGSIVARRGRWAGCQWVFWATITLGLIMSAIGLTGWAADEMWSRERIWLAWPAVFALFGSIAPLFALLAQPHRGAREPLAATTAVDIAGLAVVTGFLYSFFVSGPDETAASTGHVSFSLLVLSGLQQGLVLAGMLAAIIVARNTPWRVAYERLALGAVVSFAALTLSDIEAGIGASRAAFVYDFTWILPFAFFPWAAASAPATDGAESPAAARDEQARPRPWVIFTAVALIPFLDFSLRRLVPEESSAGFRDLSTAVTIISVLPLLVARIAAERAEMQQAGATMRLLVQVIEQAQDLILVLTPDGRCRHANHAFCRAIGVDQEELVRMRAADLMHNATISADDIQATVRLHGVWRGTITRTRLDGSTFPVSATVAALKDDRGATTHIVSVERDITEERRLREQLIHNERLSAIGQLVAGVAHELNNPLQSVIGITELLMGEEDHAASRADLERIRTDGERAAKIVRNLLSFARQSTLERTRIDVNEVVRSTLSLRAYELQKLRIAVRVRYATDLPTVLANREEIQRIVLNLLLNAEQALRAAGRSGSIAIRTAIERGTVIVEVADDGPGVPPELSSRIFEPFFTTKPIGEGTGLGLSISLGIAEAHGGSLTLVPSSHGTCFALRLPIYGEIEGVPSRSSETASSSPLIVEGLSRNASPAQSVPLVLKS